ncbi:GNAT family N-acetyltransferase [Clostridium sp. LCP25S3_F8]
MNLFFEDITTNNFYDCILLSTNNNGSHYIFEEFVDSVAFSVAISKVESKLIPKIIFSEKDMVGFALYGYCQTEKHYKIWTILIDHKFQGKGLGKAALKKIIEELKDNKDCNEIYLNFHPKNIRAKNLYESLGFKYTGEKIWINKKLYEDVYSEIYEGINYELLYKLTL